jgi:hypothetical protein
MIKAKVLELHGGGGGGGVIVAKSYEYGATV